VEPEEEDNEGGNVDLDGQITGKCAVIKTSTRQVTFICYINNLMNDINRYSN
jgi:26S proteasome regulatory subunit T5